jgi:hypothetical protein
MVYTISCPYGCNSGNSMYTIYPGHTFRERYIPYMGQSRNDDPEKMNDRSGNPLFESQPPDVHKEMLWCTECRKAFVLKWKEVISETVFTVKTWQLIIEEVSVIG